MSSGLPFVEATGQPWVPHGGYWIDFHDEERSGNRGYPTLPVSDYWNWTGLEALDRFRVSVLLVALSAGGGSPPWAVWSICIQSLFLNDQFKTMQRLGLYLAIRGRQPLRHRRVFKPGRADRLNAYLIGTVGILDAFPAEAMVDGRDHPCGNEDSDKVNIPNNLEVLRCKLRSDASDLPINNPRVRFRSAKWCRDFQAKVELTEPVFFKEHKERWGALTSKTCVAGIKRVTSHSARNSIILASSFGRIFCTSLSVASISSAGAVVGMPTVRLAMAPVAVLLSLRTSCAHAPMQTEHVTTAPSKKRAHLPRELQSRNDTQDLLFLQDYAHKLAHTQLTLEEICTSLHRTTLLSGIISAQDRRALQTTCCCLNSLRIRVEALANVIEQAVITRPLQLMQERVQMHRPEALNTENTSCLSRGSLHHSVADKDSGQR